jgi:dTDP-4-amino-4,6-dideoxy-D-galactose acyltransferase
MSIQPILYLAWDTQQLGVPTAKITLSAPHLSALHEILKKSRAEGLKLIYVLLNSNEKEAISEAEKQEGLLVDHKITYCINLTSFPSEMDKNIMPYTEKSPSMDLLNLTYESGKYSRFRTDPRITHAQFQQIYKEWISNSINHTIADEVLVFKQGGKIHGMVTLGEKNQRGDIGLLAVDENMRGQQIGTKLVQAAHIYFLKNNYIQAQVVTQQTNIPACRLYEKCGYHIEKTECFFHFWL